MNIRELLSQKVQQAMVDAGIPDTCSPHVAPSKKPGFGDYQANGAMGAAKQLKKNPRELAAEIVDRLDLTDVAEKVEIAGPGFINIHLAPKWLVQQAEIALADGHLGVSKAQQPQTVVVDYSAPNLAKEMHVGHLRSTIIGDAQVRVMEFLGHKVVRQNHIGDWGTQFGMLIAQLEEVLAEGNTDFKLEDLEKFYRESRAHFEASSEFADKSRDYVVKLQGGDARVLDLWHQFIDLSMSHSEEIYQKLNVSLTRDDVMGESAYNDDLPVLVAELESQGLAVTDEGAKVVFLEELADKEGNPSVVIIQKKEGGYLYATTDLAAIRHRHTKLQADRCLYFIDQRQALHMKQVYTLARKAGFAPESMELTHCAFGTMMGEDGKPFKSRSGETIKLADLLEEAIERATAIVKANNEDWDDATCSEVGRKVGIGAVKYADLSKTRTNDYVFSWDGMMSFEGNTAPYMQYAYARVQSIFAKAGITREAVSGEMNLVAPQEIALGLKLVQFEEVIQQVNKEALPHMLCNYLYDVASLYMSFYEHCPILKSDVSEEVRQSRLKICALVARTLEVGLDLLGIEVMERM